MLISLALGLLAAALGFLYLDSRETQLLRRSKELDVMVASRYIPAYTRLDEDWVSFRKIPSDYVPQGAVLEASEINGKLTLAPLAKGEPVLFNKLVRSSLSLAAAVPEGRRAFSLAVDAVSGVSGLLRPGDVVDVLLLTEGEEKNGRAMAATLFQLVRVLAVGSLYDQEELKGKEREGFSTVTLALSPQECEVLLYAQNRGKIHLTLRSPEDKQMADLKSANYASILARLKAPGEGKAQVVEIIRGSDKQKLELHRR
jgi:pilus assembly protein CpaB